ncbi:MAG TPA: DRTGG domain-containing protein [Thermodesulfovibrionia bacterium]|nr:DRTGG domain-containing protein [Thermodesulfovibrionia bacterium]
MTIRSILDIIDAVLLSDKERHLDIEVTVACGADLMSDVLAYSESGLLLLTGLNKPQTVRTAELSDIKAIAFVRGKVPDTATIKLADEKDIPLLVTGLSMFEACGRLYQHGLRGVSTLCILNARKR